MQPHKEFGLLNFIEAQLKPCIFAPWNGVMVPIIVRELNFAQIRDCGDFSLIQTTADILSNKRQMSISEMLAYSELQYKIVKNALVSPTLDEIMSLNEYDLLAIEAKKEITALQEIIYNLPDGPKADKLQNELDTMRLDYEFILPADFVGWIMSYALKIDDSDIKLVSEDMLFEAAIRAKEFHGSIADHLPGRFTDFHRVDINNRGLVIYYDRTKKEK